MWALLTGWNNKMQQEDAWNLDEYILYDIYIYIIYTIVICIICIYLYDIGIDL